MDLLYVGLCKLNTIYAIYTWQFSAINSQHTVSKSAKVCAVAVQPCCFAPCTITIYLGRTRTETRNWQASSQVDRNHRGKQIPLSGRLPQQNANAQPTRNKSLIAVCAHRGVIILLRRTLAPRHGPPRDAVSHTAPKVGMEKS